MGRYGGLMKVIIYFHTFVPGDITIKKFDLVNKLVTLFLLFCYSIISNRLINSINEKSKWFNDIQHGKFNGYQTT